MRVVVVDREAMAAEWGMPGLFRVITVSVEIADTCPWCGRPRGVPVRRTFHEDGVNYSVDCWKNPCGHIDFYEAVLAEARGANPTSPNSP